MIRKAAICATTCFALTACGGSGGSFNPFNWFRQSQPSETIEVVPEAQQVDSENRSMVQDVISLKIDPTPGGAIIRAVGLPPTQGWHSAELVPRNEEIPVNGVLIYEFRIVEPVGFERVVNQASREVVVGHFVSDQKLESVSAIEVRAARNGLISRR